MAADEFLKQETDKNSPDSIETGYFDKRRKQFNKELWKGIKGTKPKAETQPKKQEQPKKEE